MIHGRSWSSSLLSYRIGQGMPVFIDEVHFLNLPYYSRRNMRKLCNAFEYKNQQKYKWTDSPVIPPRLPNTKCELVCLTWCSYISLTVAELSDWFHWTIQNRVLVLSFIVHWDLLRNFVKTKLFCRQLIKRAITLIPNTMSHYLTVLGKPLPFIPKLTFSRIPFFSGNAMSLDLP